MPRLTASLTDEQYEHVSELAEELDVSLSEVMRRLIDAHYLGDVKNDALLKAEGDEDMHQEVMHEMSNAQKRIRELEERVAELEDELERLVDEIEEANDTEE